VAVSLLKSSLGKSDYIGTVNELKYIRTKEGKETDFALVENNKISNFVEAKLAAVEADRNLKYFTEKYGIKGIQAVKDLKREKFIGKIDIVLAENYLEGLFL